MADSPELVVREWFEHLWNRGDQSTIDRLMHADAVFHGLPSPDGQPLRGPGAFTPFYQSFRSAIPDIAVEMLHVIERGDHVVARYRVTGTHRGEGLGFPPTQRRIDIQGMSHGHVVDGQLHEGWNCVDFLTMYRQLGAEILPPQASRTAGS
jgi:steroid delta-isomerase-like uncharacterized protein